MSVGIGKKIKHNSLIASIDALSRIVATIYGPKNAAGITTLNCLAAKLPTFFKPYKSPIKAGRPAAAPPKLEIIPKTDP